MVKEPAGKWVVPNPQLPRSFGLMNIIFGIMLLIAAAGYAVTYIYGPAIQRWSQQPFQQQMDAAKAERATKIAELKKQEAEAKTAEEKEALAEQRAALESRPVPDLSAMQDLQNFDAYHEPKLAVIYTLDIASAVALNILMIVAGSGLMGLKEWARRLAITVAQLKIVRWIALVLTSMIVVVPMTLEKTQKAMASIEAQIAAGGAGCRSR